MSFLPVMYPNTPLTAPTPSTPSPHPTTHLTTPPPQTKKKNWIDVYDCLLLSGECQAKWRLPEMNAPRHPTRCLACSLFCLPPTTPFVIRL